MQVLPLLPRGSGLQPRVAEVNTLLRGLFSAPLTPAVGSPTSGHVHVSRCERTLATDDSRVLDESSWVPNRSLMPDQLHPGSAGVTAWLGCLKNEMSTVLAQIKTR